VEQLKNTHPATEKLTAFSIRLNEMIKDYERENDANIFVCNVGYRQYPDKYPNQEKLQLLDLINPEDYLTAAHGNKSH